MNCTDEADWGFASVSVTVTVMVYTPVMEGLVPPNVKVFPLVLKVIPGGSAGLPDAVADDTDHE